MRREHAAATSTARPPSARRALAQAVGIWVVIVATFALVLIGILMAATS